MNPYPSRFGASVAINVKSLFAFGFGCTSWFMWPNTADWWGLGALSIMSGIGAASLTVSAAKIMVRVYSRDKAIQLYMAQGRAPKSSEMASYDALKKAGMR